jgi:prepilin-type N-terminal cleavage/methylation domain-containing protein
MKEIFEHKINGFTLAEVIITLALTSMAVAFAYGTLSYVQKLFFSYKQQNRFMQEYTAFKERMDHEALYSEYVIEQDENVFRIKRDSGFIDLEIKKLHILMKKGTACDTFHFSAENIKKEYELMPNSNLAGRLVNLIGFETEYSKQKFNFVFSKKYDASIKLKLGKGQ